MAFLMSTTLAVFVAGLAVLVALVDAKEYGAVAGGSKFEEVGIAGETFDILSALWDASGLPRSADEPWTLFAPSDSAFVATSLALGIADESATKDDVVPALVKVLESLDLDVADTVSLILKYHVVEGSLKAEDVLAMKKLKTLASGEVIMRGGEDMEATQLGDAATSLRDPRIISTDFEDSRGLIVHTIDGVLIPMAVAEALGLFVKEEADSKFEEVGIAGETFDILSALWDASGLPRSADEPWTLFAPSDSAFVATSLALGIADESATKDDVVPALVKVLESLDLDVADTVSLILKYHVVEGSLKAEDVLAMKKLKTLASGEVIMRGGEDMEATQLGDAATSLRDPRIISTDFVDSRGLIVHTIDGVLIPMAVAEVLGLFVKEGAGVMPVASGKGCEHCEDDELCTATPWEKKAKALCLPTPPMCYLSGERNKGSENAAFVPYAPCCSGQESALAPVLGAGSWCLP